MGRRRPRKSFVFVDGGTTAYNNHAFLLFRMATEPAYKLVGAWRGSAADRLGGRHASARRSAGRGSGLRLAIPGLRLVGAAQKDLKAWPDARATWEAIRQELPSDSEASLSLATID